MQLQNSFISPEVTSAAEVRRASLEQEHKKSRKKKKEERRRRNKKKRRSCLLHFCVTFSEAERPSS